MRTGAKGIGVRLVLGLALLLATGAVHAQAEVATAGPEMQADSARLALLAEERYPRLLTEKLSGTPIVTVLFNPDGTVAETALEVSERDPTTLVVSEGQFAPFGVSGGQLRYLGVARVELPLNTVLIAFAIRAIPARVSKTR
jgi:hypothetical protein